MVANGTDSAFVKAAHAIIAIEEWAVEYEKRETMEFAGGTIILAW